jgi:UDP-2,3-diacylglucosamine hydrolase
MQQTKKIYFASDLHLGMPLIENHREHELKFVNWLDAIKDSAKEIYLLGDIFDFWFEYKRVIPKGFSRIIGKLCQLTDAGIPIHLFTGNHDIWIFDYLPAETGIIIHKEPVIKDIDGFRFFIAHGDCLTEHEKTLKLYKKIFTNKIAQWFFRWLHPDIGIKIAEMWLLNTHKKHRKYGIQECENEWLIDFAKEKLTQEHFDFFVFGHRHIAKEVYLNDKSRFFYIGDWLYIFSYCEWDGKNLLLKYLNN